MDAGTGSVLTVPAPNDTTGRQERFVEQFPEFEADFRLVHRCGTHLPAVLRGQEDPLHVLFGGDAAGLVERMYERSPVAAEGPRPEGDRGDVEVRLAQSHVSHGHLPSNVHLTPPRQVETALRSERDVDEDDIWIPAIC